MLDKARRKLAQAFEINAAGARDIAHRQIEGRKFHVLRKSLIPGRAPVRPGNQLFEDRPPSCFKALQRSLDIACTGGQCLVERDCIFHCQPGSGTNGEMCGVQGVPDKHAIAGRPFFVMDDGKLPPDRVVRDQSVAVERTCKNPLTKTSGFGLFQLCKTGAQECGFVDLNDECAQFRFVSVVMCIKTSELSLDECLGQCFEPLCRAEPSEGFVIRRTVALSSPTWLRRTSELTPSAPITRSGSPRSSRSSIV